MEIRRAELSDVDAMVQLSERFRARLAEYSPIFWRRAADSAEKQARFFRALLPLPETLAFVAVAGGNVVAFIA